ncbi:MAG: sugar transferase [Propionibacteriaceae bacterium]|nr:sugar transferase [Propionibacteriaceae bacterium]
MSTSPVSQRTATDAPPAPVIAPWKRNYRTALIGVDVLAVAVSSASTALLRFDLYDPLSPRLAVPWSVVLPCLAALWLAMLSACRSRSDEVVGSGTKEYQRVATATLWTFGLAALASYVAQADLSRGFVVTTLPIGLVALLAGRWLMRQWLLKQRRAGRCLTSALGVGLVADLADIEADMDQLRAGGYEVSGICLVDEPRDGADPGDAALETVLGDLVRGGYRAVIIFGGLDRRQLRRLAWRLESSDVEFLLRTSLIDVAGHRITMQGVEGVSVAHVDLPTFDGWQYAVKRVSDVVFSALALLVLSPVYLVIAALIKREDGGPVFFTQQRIGLNGKPFTMHKFRTMVPDAEARKRELAELNEAAGPLFKIAQDPRVTRVGRVLRKYSLDELPQFWTVLRGPMSIVGPRPQLPEEVAQHTSDDQRRLLIKPGITGLWQISGRANLDWEDATRLDLRYVENWSFLNDAIIVIKTVFVAARGTGGC